MSPQELAGEKVPTLEQVVRDFGGQAHIHLVRLAVHIMAVKSKISFICTNTKTVSTPSVGPLQTLDPDLRPQQTNHHS